MPLTRRAFLGTLGSAIAAGQARNRPNIVFILSDDHHYLGGQFAGNPHVQTPNLDKLANSGIYFKNAISSCPQCAPSRGILLSGFEPFQSGMLSNNSRDFTTIDGPTCIRQMQNAGYKTVLIGKWHAQMTPRACGFTESPFWIRGGDKSMDSLPLRTGFEGPPTTMKGRTEASATQAAVTFLQARHSTPFFLWVSYFSSTSGIEPESKFSALYETKDDARIAPPGHPKSAQPFQWKKYYSWLSSIDEGVGRIIAAVEKSGLMSDTVICFCGDNGLLAGAHGKQGKTWPWEASIRVPLIFAGAGVKQGFVSDQPVSTIDLPETWLDFARVKSFRELPGRSIKATVESGKVVIDDSYSCWCEPNSGLSPPYRLIRTRTHKLIQWQSGETQLFEWLTDPAEQKDLARDPESKKVLGQLKRKLANHMAAEKDPMLRS